MPRSYLISLGALGALGALGLALASEADAYACGGCFAQQTSGTVVTGHRMVVSLGPQQTVLWDQIQYAGDPTEFAWVLPVKPGAVIQPSTSAFFEVLEAGTSRQIQSPQYSCRQNGPLRGCSNGASASFGASDGLPVDPVTVVHEGTVGPYETVTLQTSTPGALNGWLTMHGYNVDATSQPVIDAYVAEGFDFIALRLQPGKGVRQMTPVRVVMPGASNTLPLRMVGIGTGATVPIVLYVIGEGRYAVQGAPQVTVQTGLLTYDFATKSSNYANLRQLALAQNGGLGWLTAYAQKSAFTINAGVLGPAGYDTTLLDAYSAQAYANGETTTRCNSNVQLDAQGSAQVVDPCAGMPVGSPSCAPVPYGQIDVHSLECGAADDIGVALLGLHPADVWISRLEASLPHAALDHDLVLGAADPQVEVPRSITATISENVDKACGTTVLFADLKAPKMPPWAFGAALVAGVMGAFGARRRRHAASRQHA